MKKSVLTILSILILSTGIAYAKTLSNAELTAAIKLYKAQNYTEAYSKLQTSIKKDPSNPLAYYYLAMVYTQVGNKEEAIANYDKAITLSSTGSNLNRYATKGKICLEDANKCRKYDADTEDNFIMGRYGQNFSQKARSEYEKLKIENMMREINRSEEIQPQDFREFKDFSGMNNEAAPTNDEIVAAIRTLQRAGIAPTASYSDMSLLMGTNSGQNNLLNLMGGASLSPQIIQAMMSNNMSLGF